MSDENMQRLREDLEEAIWKVLKIHITEGEYNKKTIGDYAELMLLHADFRM